MVQDPITLYPVASFANDLERPARIEPSPEETEEMRQRFAEPSPFSRPNNLDLIAATLASGVVASGRSEYPASPEGAVAAYKDLLMQLRKSSGE